MCTFYAVNVKTKSSGKMETLFDRTIKLTPSTRKLFTDDENHRRFFNKMIFREQMAEFIVYISVAATGALDF
jgi:hypothetical protein